MRVPPPVQALSLLFAVGVAVFNLAPGVVGLGEDPIAASGHLLTAALFLPLFLWVGALPDHAGATLRQRMGLELTRGGHVVAAVVHVLFLYLLVGLTAIATADGLSTLAETGENPAGGGITSETIVAGLIINMVLFLVASLTWVLLVEGRGWAGLLRRLGMPPAGLPTGALWGLGATLVVVVLLAALALGMQEAGLEGDNPQAEAIAAAITPALAVAIGLMASIGEEVYFRGFLQPKTGIFVQALFFGLIHATYLTPLQVVLPFLLGLFFGVLRRRVNLWAPLVAHALYNTLALLGAIYADELAALAGLV